VAGCGGCPAPDLTYDPGVDSLVERVEQIANLTTDTATTSFVDLGDQCASSGPARPFRPPVRASTRPAAALPRGRRAVDCISIGDFARPRVQFMLSSASPGTGATRDAAADTDPRRNHPRCIVQPGCGDGVVGFGEACDGASDAACPAAAPTASAPVHERRAGDREECDWSDDSACQAGVERLYLRSLRCDEWPCVSGREHDGDVLGERR
jgi:hypothetical protein